MPEKRGLYTASPLRATPSPVSRKENGVGQDKVNLPRPLSRRRVGLRPLALGQVNRKGCAGGGLAWFWLDDAGALRGTG
jgi:hypothetical protein